MEGRTDSVELRKRINLYFDHALNKEEENNLLEQVKSDTSCSKMFHKEKSVRELIKTRAKCSSASPDLIQNIRDVFRT